MCTPVYVDTLTVLQDLFNKFQSLILPEVINYILMEDEGVLEMIDTVVNFSLSSYPDMSIQDALSAINTGLTEYANKVWSHSSHITHTHIHTHIPHTHHTVVAG